MALALPKHPGQPAPSQVGDTHPQPPRQWCHLGTATQHWGPYRLPWKANPWRARLPRGSWLAGQPLRSHEARVTLEGKRGCQCQRCHRVPRLPPIHSQAPTYLLALGAHHADLSWPALPGEDQGVKAPHVQHHSCHGPGWSGGQTLLPEGCPRGCPGTTHHYSHHVLGAPACPAVPRRPSHPSGPVGQTDSTPVISHATQLGTDWPWHF